MYIYMSEMIKPLSNNHSIVLNEEARLKQRNKQRWLKYVYTHPRLIYTF